MDMGDFRGWLTAILLVLFLAVWAWSWSQRRGRDFDEARHLPLEDDKRPPRKGSEKERAS
jgi:cytochrome c oxidase cbb3-type subunit 4